MEISSGLGFGNMQHTDLICFINLIASVQYRTPEQILQSDFRHSRMQETFHNLTHNCSSFFLFFFFQVGVYHAAHFKHFGGLGGCSGRQEREF